jgi:predicted SprT family Zn-dependent metalloprotease
MELGGIPVELDAAESMCRGLMTVHLGPAWSFAWDRALRRFGQCRYDDRQITLSRHLVELNSEWAVRDTVLHEIAHALASRDAGHGAEWQRIATGLGARPRRVVDGTSVRLPAPAFVGECPGCGWRTRAHRRRKLACRRCCDRYNRGRFSSRFELAWMRSSDEAA